MVPQEEEADRGWLVRWPCLAKFPCAEYRTRVSSNMHLDAFDLQTRRRAVLILIDYLPRQVDWIQRSAARSDRH